MYSYCILLLVSSITVCHVSCELCFEPVHFVLRCRAMLQIPISPFDINCAATLAWRSLRRDNLRPHTPSSVVT